MPFCTDDPQVRDDWLTIGAARQLQGTDAAHRITARLLGNDPAL